jgi:hypothetical protein
VTQQSRKGDVVSANSSKIPEQFKAFYFLIGDWVGTFADGKTTDYQHFEWLHDGKFIKNHHHSTGERGGHAGDSIYALDPQRKVVTFWYWDNSGGISQGDFKVEGEALQAEQDYRGEQNYKIRSIWKPLGPNDYEAQQFIWQEGEWRPFWTTHYRREK